MSDPKIGTSANTGLRVQIDQSRTRQTANTSFGAVMSEGLNRGADAVLNAGQLAAPFIPGGAVLSAAITGVGSLKATAQGARTGTASRALSAANAVGVSSGSAAGASSGVGTTPSAVAGGTGSTQDALAAMAQLQEMSQSFNVQYLMLQQKMQDESRRFTILSNIMKTKHDTAKNSISNVR